MKKIKAIALMLVAIMSLTMVSADEISTGVEGTTGLSFDGMESFEQFRNDYIAEDRLFYEYGPEQRAHEENRIDQLYRQYVRNFANYKIAQYFIKSDMEYEFTAEKIAEAETKVMSLPVDVNDMTRMMYRSVNGQHPEGLDCQSMEVEWMRMGLNGQVAERLTFDEIKQRIANSGGKPLILPRIKGEQTSYKTIQDIPHNSTCLFVFSVFTDDVARKWARTFGFDRIISRQFVS